MPGLRTPGTSTAPLISGRTDAPPHLRRTSGRLAAPAAEWVTGFLLIVPLVVGLVGGTSVEGSVDDYIGKPIASVRLLIEGRETTDAALSRAILTRVGQPLSMAAVRESITHLIALGRFDDVRVEATPEDNRVALSYLLSPVHPVTRIEFAGRLNVPGVDVGQMRKALVNRYGASPPLERNRELTEIVAAALGERGYLHPDVRPRAELFHDPDRAVLVFTIDPGPRTLVGSVDIKGTAAVPNDELLRRLGLVTGEPYQRRELDARIDRYVADRRKAGYYDAKVLVVPSFADSDRVANLALTLSPGFYVRVAFTGDPVPSGAREDLVPIEREGSVDEDLLEDSTNRIEDYFRAEGYRDAKAPHSREQSAAELLVTFNVTRGPLYKVSRVEIGGNSSIPLSDFESALRLRDGQPFSEAKLDADVATIETIYRRQGFVGVRVQPGEESERGETTGAGVVALLVRIVINEGPRTVVTAVHVPGSRAVPEETLAKDLGLQPGRPYSETQLVLDRDALQLRYLNLGYLSATVEANSNLSADRTRAEPIFTVREGPRVFVEHILIVGNVRTSVETIERELRVKSGDPLSAEARLESQRRLMALGLFRRIQITDQRTGDEGIRDLIVSVEESPATTMAYGGGVEGRVRVVRSAENPDIASDRFEFAPRGSIEVNQRNFFGKNRSANLFTSVSLHPKDSPVFVGQPVTDTGGFFTEYRVLAQFREPKIFDTTADALFAGTLEQQIRASFNFYRRGLSAEVAKRLTPTVTGTANYQIQRTHVFDLNLTDIDQSVIDRLFPEVRISSISSSLVVNTLDDLLEPSSGHYISGNIQLAARALGSEVGFAKTYIRGQLFRGLRRAHGVVLAGNAQVGLATGFAREGPQGGPPIDDIPISERFFVGGDPTVRGFPLDSIGIPGQTLSPDGFPIGGSAMLVFKTEVRVPVRAGIGVAGFFDSGQVFAGPADLDFTELRSAVGFGLRYRSPFGPIRVDLGFKIHPQVIAGHRESPTALHFSFGQAF